jgi:hypothetical protein
VTPFTGLPKELTWEAVFLNLSNHPAAKWSAGQLAAAEALGGAVRDEPFPLVPPDASSDEVVKLALGLLARIESLPLQAAMVQGEFTLTFYLVAALQSRGIPCYAATTRHITESVILPGGAAEKKARFEFVQFRRYIGFASHAE